MAAEALVRVLAKLSSAGTPPRDRAGTLAAFLAKAHTRMHWKQRASGGPMLSASVAVAWVVGQGVAWAQVGTAQVGVFREGRLQALGRSDGATQRMLAGSTGLGDDSAVFLREGWNVGQVDLAPSDRLLLANGSVWDVGADPLGELLGQVDGAQAVAVALRERAVARVGPGAHTVMVWG